MSFEPSLTMAPEEFGKFYERWTAEYNERIRELQGLLVSQQEGGSPSSEVKLEEQIDKITQHYREYYRVKKEAAAADVFQVLNPSWKSPLETAFMWMGGWRPSAAFRLALSVNDSKDKSASKGCDGLAAAGCMSQQQLECLKNEQATTKSVEDQISTRVADLQKKTANEALIDAAAAVAALSDEEVAADPKSVDKLKAVLDDKIRALSELVLQSDQLRLAALEVMLKILTPGQAAEYLVTAGRLHTAYMEVGRDKEPKSNVSARDFSFLL